MVLSVGCTAQAPTQTGTAEQSSTQGTEKAIAPEETETEAAQITNVNVSGNSGNYTFAITIASPDTGCDAYANWWEVVSPDETLIYRRILAHSHINEQPFTRSGGPINIETNQPVIVRVHMHPSGYSNLAMEGTTSKGFIPTTLPPSFAAELASAEPQPNGCAF